MKITHPLVRGEVKKIKPNIFAVSVSDDYDRAMLFCRYQEYYESPYKEIRRKHFTLEYFMRLYCKKRKTPNFQYPSDWGGYNIPSDVLMSAHQLFESTYNEYDPIMKQIIDFCVKSSKNSPFYLIGIDKFNSTQTMEHELSHGMYYTDSEYRKSCDLLISQMDKNDYNFAKRELIMIGYSNDKKIIDDEIQAFFSTGLYGGLINKRLKPYTKKFKENFKKYSK